MELRYFPNVNCPAVGGPIGFSIGRIHGCMGEELFVCCVMRWTTSAISSAPKREKSTRCKVWQLTQPPSCSFCSRVPGTLMSHSAFDNCMASFVLLVTLSSFKSSCVACAVTSAAVLGSSYPTARIVIAYFPGVSRSRGNLYSPCALLTTQVVIVEPTFFAPISTPSMALSACEVTLPDSAKEDAFCPINKPVTANATKQPTVSVRNALLMLHLHFLKSF